MAVYAKSAGGDFEAAPAGLCNAVCVDVVELGLKPDMNGNMKEKIRIVFQTDKKLTNGKLAIVGAQFTLSAHEKAKLRQFLESWRGKKFTATREMEDLDLEKLIGASAFLNIIHEAKGDKTYANISTVLPAQKKLVADGSYTRKKDRTEGYGNSPAPRPTRNPSPAAPQPSDPDLPPVEDDDVPF